MRGFKYQRWVDKNGEVFHYFSQGNSGTAFGFGEWIKHCVLRAFPQHVELIKHYVEI